MTLAELKVLAQELGLTKDFISQYGDLRKKTTWQVAVNAFEFSEVQPQLEAEPEPEPDNIFEPLPEPEVINITEDSHPEIWEILQPPTEPEPLEFTQSVSVNLNTYEVINEPPEIPVVEFKAEPEPEQKKTTPTLPKLPLQDFFVWLFSPPKALETVQLESEYLGRI